MASEMRFDRECAADYFGLWLAEPRTFERAVRAVLAGTMRPEAAARRGEAGGVLYDVTSEGIAVVRLAGFMMKGISKYGGTSTVRAREAVRVAAADEKVKAILLAVDSPGGTAAGTAELARDVARAAFRKPVWAHVEDLAASAAYWVAAGASRITASETSEVGSIGVVAVVEDTSGQAEADGIKVHVVATGPYKGAFAPGAPVTPVHLAYLQERVDDLNSHFRQAVGVGRALNEKQLDAASDGRVWIAAKAAGLGLVDAVQGQDATLAELRGLVEERGTREEVVRRRRRAGGR